MTTACPSAATHRWLPRLGLAGLLACAGHAAAANCHAGELPSRVTAGNSALVLNGTGLREATWLKLDVYLAGLYLPAPSVTAAEVLAPGVPKQMRLKLLRDVTRQDMASSIRAGFRNAAGPRYRDHLPVLEALLAMIPPLSAGDVFVLDYRPQTGAHGNDLRLLQGTRVLGSLPGGEFAQTLFATWIGATPVNHALRSALLGGPCQE